MKNHSASTKTIFLAGLLLASTSVFASPLVYQPVNPSFGGNPNNGPGLLNEAQAQNTTTAPVRTQTPADRLRSFNQALQNAVLNRVQSSVISRIVSVDGGLIPGTVTTQDFIITVSQDARSGLVSVTTTDRNTGQTSTFEIGSTPTQ